MTCSCLTVGRLDKVGDPVRTPEGTVIQTMYCDACGSQIDFVLQDFDEKNLDGKKPHRCKGCDCQLYPDEGEFCERCSKD